MAQRFCLLGHDTDVVGRSTSRNCRECRRLFDRRRRLAYRRRAAAPAPGRFRRFLAWLGL